MARKTNWRSVLGAAACTALVVAAGCRKSADHVETTSSSAGETDIRPGGQDIVVGEGGNAVVIPGVNTATPPTGLPTLGQKINDDFVMTNGVITIGVDGVGMDTSSPILETTTAISHGVPIENTVAPSGGNLVDISINGSNNDNWVTNGIGIIGASITGGKGAFTPPDNLVFWFEVIPETSSHTADVGLIPVQGSVMRRLICRGVILNNRSDRTGLNEAVDGAATNSAFTVKTQAPAAAIPASFRENVPDRLNILVHTHPAFGDVVHVPIFVTQVYTMFEGSPVLTESTVIQHVVPNGTDVRIAQAAEFIGLGAAGNSSLDTLASGPMWVDPLAVLVGAGLSPATATAQLGQLVTLGLLPAGSGPGGVRPSVTTGELNRALKLALGKPAFPGDAFGQGVCQWLSFIGRGEPAVSYTLFDPLAGGMVFNRDPRQSTIGLAVMLRSDTTIPSDKTATAVNEATTGRIAWARKISVGNGQDSASSSDIAVAIERTAPRVATFTPNSIFADVTVRGRVTNAPEGTVIVASEVQPTFFNTFNPTVATPSAAGGGLNSPSFLGTGLGLVIQPPFPLEVGITLTASVIRATKRPDAHGEWHMNLPLGARFQAINPLNTTQIVALFVNDTTSTYSFKAVLPGGGTTGGTTSIDLGTVTLGNGQTDADIGDHDLTSVGTVNFTIRDSATHDLIPGFVTILTAGGGTPTDDFSFPTGLEEGLERSKISGNVAMTASGIGQFVLAPGKTYTLVASAGPDYETDSDSRTIATATALNVPFELVRVGNVARDHLSGDFHMHSGESPDSGVPSDDRVRSLLAEGIEVYAQTEHDKIGNHAPAINVVRRERPDIDRRLKHLYGEEFTTDLPWLPPGPGSAAGPQCIGHFNCYPETYRPERRKGGAPDDELRPPGVAFVNMRMTDGLFIVTTSADPIPQTNEIVQLNHPRSAESSSALDGGDGFYSNLAFAYPAFATFSADTIQPFGSNSASGLAPVAIKSPGIQLLVDGGPSITANPALAALAPLAAVLKGAMGFDAMEVLNGSQSNQRYLQHRADWFAMLNRGVIKTAVGTSDSHRIDDRRTAVATNFDVSFTGIARTYLLTDSRPDQLTNADIVAMVKPTYETPAVASGAPTALNVFGTLQPAQRLHGNRQKAIVSTGPMITVSVAGVAATNPIGQAIAFTTLTADITVTVTGPTWVMANVNQVRLVVNGVTSTAMEAVPVGGTTSKSFTFTAVDLSQTPQGGSYNGDTWVVAEAGQTVADIGNNVSPAAPYSQVYPGVPVVAFTNPIFFDRDGNLATFDACRNNE